MSTQLQFPSPVDGVVDEAAGEAAKVRGMGLAEAATPVPWAEACDAAIAVMAATGRVFQAADLIAEGLVDEPEDHHQWGVRFRKAARDGVIKEAAPTQVQAGRQPPLTALHLGRGDGMNKDVQQLLRRVRRQGFAVRLGGSGHYRVSRGGQATTVSATPRSGRRAHANIRASLKRIGARL